MPSFEGIFMNFLDGSRARKWHEQAHNEHDLEDFRPDVCPECGGDGRFDEVWMDRNGEHCHTEECTLCLGTGIYEEVTRERTLYDIEVEDFSEYGCDDCGGNSPPTGSLCLACQDKRAGR